MRCFKVATSSEAAPYITILTSPYPHVGIGEGGRGRKYVRFPVGQRFADQLTPEGPCPCDSGGGGAFLRPGNCPKCGVELFEKGGMYYHPHGEGMCRPQEARVKRASVIKTKESTLLLVKEKDPGDRRALVHLAIPAGFRGGAKYTSVDYNIAPCPERGANLSPFYGTCGVPEGGRIVCQSCGITLSKEPQDKYDHPDTGNIRVYEELGNASGITVLAQGQCAQGEAGRMGSHPEYLVIMEPGTTIRTRRYGRLYGAPGTLFVHWDGEELRLGEYDVIFPPSCEAEEGEVI